MNQRIVFPISASGAPSIIKCPFPSPRRACRRHACVNGENIKLDKQFFFLYYKYLFLSEKGTLFNPFSFIYSFFYTRVILLVFFYTRKKIHISTSYYTFFLFFEKRKKKKVFPLSLFFCLNK